jgi:acyl-CoA synthetase (NDP forming)
MSKKLKLKKDQLDQRQKDAQRIKDVLTGAKLLSKHIEPVLEISGFKLKLTDSDAVQRMLDNEITQLEQYGENEESTYGEVI